ncbi:MAG: hypothetical protein ABIF08_02430 [Nanoarchaeota archaeon]
MNNFNFIIGILVISTLLCLVFAVWNYLKLKRYQNTYVWASGKTQKGEDFLILSIEGKDEDATQYECHRDEEGKITIIGPAGENLKGIQHTFGNGYRPRI